MPLKCLIGYSRLRAMWMPYSTYDVWCSLINLEAWLLLSSEGSFKSMKMSLSKHECQLFLTALTNLPRLSTLCAVSKPKLICTYRTTLCPINLAYTGHCSIVFIFCHNFQMDGFAAEFWSLVRSRTIWIRKVFPQDHVHVKGWCKGLHMVRWYRWINLLWGDFFSEEKKRNR